MDHHIETVYQIIDETLARCTVKRTEEYGELLRSVLADRRPSAQSMPWLLLPILTCEALEGKIRYALHVAAAVELWRLSAGCVDEWQDKDTDEALWQAIGPEPTVNLAIDFLSFALQAVDRLTDLGASPFLVLDLHKAFHHTLSAMCAGQAADLSGEVSLDDYEWIAGAKSGALFQLGCQAGALVSEATPDEVACYAEFGYNLGIVAQMWNDVEGMAGLRGKADADQLRSLPAIAAQAMAAKGDSDPSEDRMAGSLYAMVQLQMAHRRTREALDRCPQPGHLSQYLDLFDPRQVLARAAQANPPQGADGEG